MRTMIAVPCMDMVHTDFFRSCIGMTQLGDGIQWTTCQCSLIYEARNTLADIAIREDFDRVLWLDSDMVFDKNLLIRLSEHLDLGREMVTGLYFGRKAPIRPMIYKDLRLDPDGSGHGFRPVAENFDDYERDSLFEVAGCGFGAVLMTTALLRRVRDLYGPPFFPAQGFGEDFSFCRRVRGYANGKIWCDSSVKLGHAGTALFDEELYRTRNRPGGSD